MKKYEFKNAKFIKTAMKPKDYPVLRNLSGKIMPEIAVAGRSNVGKSSLLNDLLSAPGLVKTSSTPGKTQAINFFTVNHDLAFVDLPGYGYAAVPMSVKKEWGPMVHGYLEQRESLKLILFLIDIRRIPNDDDKLFVNWVVSQQKAMILVLTKVDKVNQKERTVNAKLILEHLNLDQLHHVQYSVQKKWGQKELALMINDALADELKE
jgi:GTP-binding protein